MRRDPGFDCLGLNIPTAAPAAAATARKAARPTEAADPFPLARRRAQRLLDFGLTARAASPPGMDFAARPVFS